MDPGLRRGDDGANVEGDETAGRTEKKASVAMTNTSKPNVEIHRRVDAVAQTVEETEMVDGKPHGTRRIWSSASIQIGMAEFQRGLLHGRCLVWFDDGRLYIESSYFEGRLDGDYRSFWPNGKTREIGRYADGKRTGLYQWFDETGKLVSEQAF
jgi:antitoxin component YwqK of YwqJK toxin-antitoxin module